MQVLKRNGSMQQFNKEKIHKRISKLSDGLKNVDITYIVDETYKFCCDGIETKEIDEQSIKICDDMRMDHWDYDTLATRICSSNVRKEAPKYFSEYMELINTTFPHMVNENALAFIRQHATELDKAIVHDRDVLFKYNGYKTIKNKYLLRPYETPQYMYMRIAVQVAGLSPFGDKYSGIDATVKTYNYLSEHYYVHATPTIINACFNGQLDSCFLLGTDDSINGIMDTVKNCSLISKSAGGIGVHVSNLRGYGQPIKTTNGKACGVPQVMKIFEAVARTWDQGGKRPGAIAIYIEPWHIDIFEFLKMKLNVGDSENTTRTLNLALWLNDVFIERLINDEEWSLFSEDTAPNLSNTHGAEFRALYTQYEQEGKALKTCKARDLLPAITESLKSAGQPYLLNKDAVNERNMQSNIGVIKSSNLCTEIFEYSDHEKYASCTLASINLPRFAQADGTFDFAKLAEVSAWANKMLDNVIEISKYPVPESDQYTKDSRPVGLGIQGLATTFTKMGLPFTSKSAEELDVRIAKCIYESSLQSSCTLAKLRGAYKYFKGSPAERGQLHTTQLSTDLVERIKRDGLRNSLHCAYMPTASTSDIFSNTQSFEPLFSIIYNKDVTYGKQMIINNEFMQLLHERGLWSPEIKNKIIENGGRSIQDIAEIPDDIKAIFKTAFDIKSSTLMKRASKRGEFVDQGMSLNLYQGNINQSYVYNVIVLGHKLRLKTISYYTYSIAKGKAMMVCSLKNKDACTMCSA